LGNIVFAYLVGRGCLLFLIASLMIIVMKKLSIAIFLLASACASTPEMSNTLPEWVQHPEQSYPSTRYLVAVGTGSSREAAIQDAKKQMAESFVVKVALSGT
jgi:hypothetical protein